MQPLRLHLYVHLWLLSIMPNRPVRDKWDYPRKMERHFPIKPRQPIRNSSCHFLSFPNSLIRANNRFVKNGTLNFDRNIPTEISGPPPKVIPNIPVERNRNGPFHLNCDRNFRNLWHNGKHPICTLNWIHKERKHIIQAVTILRKPQAKKLATLTFKLISAQFHFFPSYWKASMNKAPLS